MFHAVEQQMRPILMMALSACIGLLPAAISTGIGSQVQRPLATVIVGRHADRADHVARGRAGAADAVPASGTRRRARRRSRGAADRWVMRTMPRSDLRAFPLLLAALLLAGSAIGGGQAAEQAADHRTRYDKGGQADCATEFAGAADLSRGSG